MQAGARHALRRAGGVGVATARSSPAALHTVGQNVRAHGGRDEFTGAEARGLRGRSRDGLCHCGRRMRRSAACSIGRCQLAPPCRRELRPQCCTRPRVQGCCGGRWGLSCRRSSELARAAPRGRAYRSTARLRGPLPRMCARCCRKKSHGRAAPRAGTRSVAANAVDGAASGPLGAGPARVRATGW